MSAAPLPHAADSASYRQVATAACFGTFLEWYDFLTFAALASHLAQIFFPQTDPVAALLASLATFGVGMVVRPLGASLFGSLGDRIGRRTVFLITIVLMGGATFLVGLLPTYAQAGLLAPALLVLLRLAQGLAVGGEIGGAAVYLTEHAPGGRRGAYTSVLQLMGPLGMMVSSAQVVALQTWLSPAEFAAWGWRVPFLVSLVLLAISIKSRLNLHESPIFRLLREQRTVSKTPLRECFADRRTLGRMGLLFFCISSGGSLLFFSAQVYTGIFLKSSVGLEPAHAGLLVLVSTLALFPSPSVPAGSRTGSAAARYCSRAWPWGWAACSRSSRACCTSAPKARIWPWWPCCSCPPWPWPASPAHRRRCWRNCSRPAPATPPWPCPTTWRRAGSAAFPPSW